MLISQISLPPHMVLREQDIKGIVAFVKKEPRTVQEVSKFIRKSWITADSYLKQINEQTGLIEIKTFRKGTQGALKVAFYNYVESLTADEIQDNIYSQLKGAKKKEDFDFMEIYQHVKDSKKKAFVDDYEKGPKFQKSLFTLLRQAKENLYIFSGNLSFVKIGDGKETVLSLIEELLKRKVRIKMLARINLATLENINRIRVLMKKYPDFIEIKHCYHPLRGFIIDDDVALFKTDVEVRRYRESEINKNICVYYHLYDKEWISWLQKVFWNYFRFSMDFDSKIRELKKIV